MAERVGCAEPLPTRGTVRSVRFGYPVTPADLADHDAYPLVAVCSQCGGTLYCGSFYWPFHHDPMTPPPGGPP